MQPQTSTIHPTAIIEDGAKIEDGVAIGPYCTIGKKVTLKKNVVLKNHVCIEGDTTIDEGSVVYPFASLGQAPQDLKFGGENSRTRIGKNCTIREYVTIQAGTEGDRMETTVGDNVLAMVGTHIAHDCVVGNNVVLANYVNLAGHVHVGNHTVIGGMSAIQQFVRIGEHVMIGGMSGVDKDVIPYGLVMGDRAYLKGLNLVGIRRLGVPTVKTRALMKAYDVLFKTKTQSFKNNIQNLHDDTDDNELIVVLKKFLSLETSRPYCVPKL